MVQLAIIQYDTEECEHRNIRVLFWLLCFMTLCWLILFCDVLSVDELQKEKEAYDKVKHDYDSTIAELAEM